MVRNYFHPKQHGPFPYRLRLPYTNEEIYSGYEEEVSFIRDGFTAWVDFETILERHAVDIRKAHAEFREASARRHVTSYQKYHFDNDVPAQRRLSIYNWNPGARRGKEGAIEKQIAGKWHIMTFQEALGYVDHELLTNRFHVTHCGGCAVLFNKDTFFPDIKVKSIYFHDIGHDRPDKVFEGESGWATQGVISRPPFRRQPLGLPFFTVMSLHINNNYAKKRGIGKKLLLTTRAATLDEQVDLVAGDFNGAAWRRATNANNIRIIEEAFADCDLPMPSGPTPLWGPGAVPGTWSDVCGFLKPPDSNERWTVRQHGAFPILHEALGIRPTDQSCHHEVWLHLDFVERTSQSHHERHERRLLLKERSAPYHYSKQKGQSRRGCKRPFAFSLEQGDHSPPIQARCYHTACEQNADLHRSATISVHRGHQRLT